MAELVHADIGAIEPIEAIREQLVMAVYGDHKPADFARRPEHPFEVLDEEWVKLRQIQSDSSAEIAPDAQLTISIANIAARGVLRNRIRDILETATPSHDNGVYRFLGKIGFEPLIERRRKKADHQLAWLLVERYWPQPISKHELGPGQ